MRNVWIVVASALLAFANFVKSQETSRNLYSSRVFSRLYRYDNLDIDTILASSRLVNNYVDCLLSRKPCPPEGKDLKRILPEALRTKCGRCSETQKENALKIITTLYSNYPQQYQALRNRWDPSGEYHRRFEEYLRGLQFNQIGSNSNGGNAGVNTNAIDTPVRNDFDRDQSQILLQTLLLSSTSTTTAPPRPNAIASGSEQQPQLAQAQITQPVAPVSITSTTTTTTSTTTTTPSPTTTTTTSTTITTSTPLTTETTTSIVNSTTGSGATSSSSSSSNISGSMEESSTASAATVSTAASSTPPPSTTLPNSTPTDSVHNMTLSITKGVFHRSDRLTVASVMMKATTVP
ncbi:uncharacterized protein LOC128743546 isoform X1 [Sabethes cyaneus]|uniref:uncharacterized protein LOC128743546 isoform X1 n=1 Tax=Sabethes cyaneus TaxID=53552 RepID=UPI00237E5ED2|nr:uncharacterized protein LOC128743546 isoform X1 [Sabethes cyaneus]